MATLIVGLVGLVLAVITWKAGYEVGRADGEIGVSQPWPWSDVVRDREEG